MGTHAGGFGTIETEHEATALEVSGTIPDWLDGSLIRNGPGRFDIAGETVDHWFDGLAMVRKFAFDDGGVQYSNRFLRTDAYEKASDGTIPGGFATGSTSMLKRIKAFILGGPYDNASVIVEQLGEETVALTETPAWVAIDPQTLETRGRAGYEGPAPSGHMACAHLGRDPSTAGAVNFEIEFGRTNAYHVYSMTAPDERGHIASVPVDEPAYMHSFALTEHYVVLTEFPFVINPLNLFKPFSSGGFIDHFRWEPERGTRLTVVDRQSGEVVCRPETAACFGFHHVNAFEDGESIVFDLETVPEAPESIAALELDRLRAGELDVPAGSIERFRIQNPRANPTVERTTIYDGGTALPTVSPAVRCQSYRYLYAQDVPQPATAWPQGVCKVDVESGTVTRHETDGYASEPVFVPHPDGTAEDDGVVLSVVLDPDEQRSHLLALTGETLEELGRATLPHALPFDFHGRYFPNRPAQEGEMDA
jgi:beta-carotene 15,15'-monooxygenase